MNAAPTNPDDAPAAGPLPDDDDWPPGADDDADLSEPADTAATRAALPVAASDAQLAAWISAITVQDERALAALYDATAGRVFGLVQRIVRDGALAEEVVEDTYFQVWRQAPRYDAARGSAITWLLAMARSRAIDALRREARFEHDTLDDEQHAESAAAPPGDELLDLARHRADLQQALLRLGAQPRQLVSMSFFRGLSHEEIADQMDLPLGTVKSQIRRALLALRELLGERAAPRLAS